MALGGGGGVMGGVPGHLPRSYFGLGCLFCSEAAGWNVTPPPAASPSDLPSPQSPLPPTPHDAPSPQTCHHDPLDLLSCHPPSLWLPHLIHHPPPSPDPPPRTSLPFPLTGPLSVCLSLRNAPPAVWGGPCPLFYQLMGGSVPYPTPLGPPPVLFCLAQGSHLGSCISAGCWATLGRLEGGTRRPLHGGEPRSNMGASPAPPVWGWGPNPGELGLQDEPYSRAGF